MLWSGGLTHVNRGCTFLNAFKSVVYRVALKLCTRNILLPEPTQYGLYGLGIEFSDYTGGKAGTSRSALCSNFVNLAE